MGGYLRFPICFECGHPRMPMVNEGLGWDSRTCTLGLFEDKQTYWSSTKILATGAIPASKTLSIPPVG